MGNTCSDGLCVPPGTSASTITDGWKAWDKVPGLMEAIKAGDASFLGKIAKAYSPPEAPGTAVDVKGLTLLHFAVDWYGYYNLSGPPVEDACKVLAALVDAGCPVNAKTNFTYKNGEVRGEDTAMHYAAVRKKEAFVELLKSRGGDPSIKNANGLDVAAWANKCHMMLTYG